MGLHG